MGSNPNPRVTILTPTTVNRIHFIDLMIQNILSQDYPHNLLEWIVVGDEHESTKKTFVQAFDLLGDIRCQYVESSTKSIGTKRNFASSLVRTKLMANLDDDDIYSKEYISESVKQLRSRSVNMVGCRDMLIFFPYKDCKMTLIRGSMVHEATIVCKKSHWKRSKYRDSVHHGEGSTMVTGSYFNEMDIRKVMICVSHDSNTYDKTRFLDATEVSLDESQKEYLRHIIDCCTPKSV